MKHLSPSNFSPKEIHEKETHDPRRDQSEIHEKPTEFVIEVEKINTFPVIQIKQQKHKHHEELFVEHPVPTTSSIVIGTAIPAIKKKHQPLSFSSIPWLSLFTNVGTLSMYI